MCACGGSTLYLGFTLQLNQTQTVIIIITQWQQVHDKTEVLELYIHQARYGAMCRSNPRAWIGRQAKFVPALIIIQMTLQWSGMVHWVLRVQNHIVLWVVGGNTVDLNLLGRGHIAPKTKKGSPQIRSSSPWKQYYNCSPYLAFPQSPLREHQHFLY